MGLRNSVSFDNADNVSGVSEILDRNAATTAAAGVAVCSGGLGVGLLIGAFPAQTLTLAGTAGALAYIGDRQFKNLPINPFAGDKDSEKSASKKDSKAEPAPAAA